MSVSNKFIEEISGDWTVKTTTADGLITLDTGLPGTTLVTGDLSVVGNVNFAGNAQIVSNAISNGTTTIVIPDASGNAVVKIAGSNVANFYTDGISVVGNVTGNYILGNGAFLTGLPSSYSNAQVANYLPTYTGNLVSLQGDVITTANISGNYILGNGSQLTGMYSNADVAAYLPTYSGNLNPGNISVINLANVGEITLSAANGNITGVNYITANYYAGNGSLLTGVIAADVGVLANLSVTGNIATGNLTTNGILSAAGNVTGGNLLTGGTVSAAGNITANGIVSTNGNVVGGNINTSGNISADGNVLAGNVSTSGNVTGGNVVGGNIYGENLSLSGNATIDGRITGSQVRIGTDTGLTNQGTAAVGIGLNAGSVNQGNFSVAIGAYAGVNGQSNNSIILNASGNTLNGTVDNAFYIDPVRNDVANTSNIVFYNTGTKEITYANSISISGNISADNISGNGQGLYSVPAASLSGNTLNSGVIYSNLTTVGTLSGMSVVGNVDITGNLTVTGNATLSGNILGDRIVNGSTEVDIDVPNGNVAVTVNAVSNVAVFTSSGIEVNGLISATGNITGNYILGNGAFLDGITSSTSIANGSSNIKIPVSSDNVIVGVGGTSNVAVFTTDGVSLTGNVTAGNILTDNLLYANGQPWDLQQPAGANNEIQYNDNGNFGASANLTFDAANGLFSTSNISTGGTITASGDVTGGNLLTSGAVSAGANVTGGNLITGGLISATGNITGGNISTAGSGGNISGANVISGTTLSATANVVGGNVTTIGEVSATGNVTGGNLITNGDLSAANLLVTTVSASGNVTGGNILTLGQVSAQGNIYGDTLSLLGNVTIDGRIQGAQVRIGTDAGLTSQGFGAVGIGLNAGSDNQGQYAVAIGSNAGATNQGNNTIVLNASGNTLNGTTASAFYVNPIRNDSANAANLVFYNVATKEVTYTNTISTTGDITAANITGNNLQFVDASATGNVVIDGDLTVSGNAYLSGNIVGDRIQNGNTIIDIQSPGGNANVSVGGINNVAVFSPDGLSLPGNVTAGNFIGNGSQLTNLQPTIVTNGTSNINIATPNGNITVSVDGTGNVAVFSNTGVTISGNLSVTGNVIGDYFVGNGTALTGVMADRGGDPNNWNTLTQMGVYTVNRVSWSGTVGTPLDSQVYVGLLEVKNSTGLALEQSFYPGTVQTANVRTQWNRNYWSGSWTAWYLVINDDQVVTGGDF